MTTGVPGGYGQPGTSVVPCRNWGAGLEIAGYEDLEEIGRGGFAVVYRAHQAQFGRQVAIKVLTNPGFGETDRARFEREALSMGRLSWHPNIVVVHETGTTATGLPYLVQEFVEGGSLGEKLRRDGPLPPEEALADMVQLCAAVQTAHEADLLHRDIKPDNALIDTFGRIKLADFGIAAVTGSTLTATGMVTATIAHAAPEVLNGDRASFASDVYGLGSTLYELLTGAPAFVRHTDESIVPLVLRVTGDPIPDLRAQGIPDPVAAAVEAAMTKDPAARPQSALDLGRMLQAAEQSLGYKVTDLPVRSGTTPPPRPGDTVVGAAAVVPPAPAAPREPGGPPPQPVTPAPPSPPPEASTAPAAPAVAATPGPPPTPEVAEATTAETSAATQLGGATGTVAAPDAQTPPPGQGYHAPLPAAAEKRSKLPLVLVAITAVAVITGAVVLFNGGGDDSGAGGGATAGTDVATTEDAGPGEATIAVGSRPFRVAAAGDAVWVTNNDGTNVSRIDPATNEVVATVDIGGQPVGIDATEEAAWVANTSAGTVVRIDAAASTLVPIEVEDRPRIVAVTDTAVWVTNLGSDSISHIVRDTNQVEATIEVEDDPRGLAATATDVWVANYAAGVVTRIDATDNRVVAEIDVGGNPVSVTTTNGAVWVADTATDTVIHIDPATNTEVGRTPVGVDPTALAAIGNDVYVSSAGDDTVDHIDAATGEVVETFDTGAAPGGLAVTETDLWVANTEDDTVSRISLG